MSVPGFGLNIDGIVPSVIPDGIGSWYLDWDVHPPTYVGWQHLNLVRGYSPDAPSIPDGDYGSLPYFVVGNELGYDFKEGPKAYAQGFADWFKFLKGQLATCRVGMGGVLSADWSVDTSSVVRNAGLNYWRMAAQEIIALGIKPDFLCQHGYTPGDWYSITQFRDQLVRYRRAATSLFGPDAELWITEFAPLWPNDQPLARVEQYMRQVVPILQNPKRGVARYAWFVLNHDGDYKDVSLTTNGVLNPLGELYQKLIAGA